MCKILERMITIRSRWYLEKDKVFSNCQSAFRERRWTTDHFFVNKRDTISKALANQISVLAIFLDIEKAYMIRHAKIFYC